MEREALTNEFLRKKFKSQFDLVNYAIKRAEYAVKSGHEPHVKIDSQNLAAKILAEITIDESKNEFSAQDASSYNPMNFIAEIDVLIEEESKSGSKGRSKKKAALK